LEYTYLEGQPIENHTVYRYLCQKYIDEFFQSGKLRLSAFREFAKHLDEQRLDAEEGRAIVKIHGENLLMRHLAHRGFDSYILSTSFREDTELMKLFNTDGYFKISDVNSFAVAIATRLEDCTQCLWAPCIYVDSREIKQTMEAKLDTPLLGTTTEKEKQLKMAMTRMTPLIRTALWPRGYLQKLECYAIQQEYRFVWYVGHAVHEPLIIECPEAIQFCERIT
jgi:hypothetical protein